MKSNSSNIEHPQQAPAVPEAGTQLNDEARSQWQPASVRRTKQTVAQTPGAVMANPLGFDAIPTAEDQYGGPAAALHGGRATFKEIMNLRIQ